MTAMSALPMAMFDFTSEPTAEDDTLGQDLNIAEHDADMMDIVQGDLDDVYDAVEFDEDVQDPDGLDFLNIIDSWLEIGSDHEPLSFGAEI